MRFVFYIPLIICRTLPTLILTSFKKATKRKLGKLTPMQNFLSVNSLFGRIITNEKNESIRKLFEVGEEVMTNWTRQKIIKEQIAKYQLWGLSIIPIVAKGKKPLVEWKEYQSRRPTADEVAEWWEKYWSKGETVFSMKYGNMEKPLHVGVNTVEDQGNEFGTKCEDKWKNCFMTNILKGMHGWQGWGFCFRQVSRCSQHPPSACTSSRLNYAGCCAHWCCLRP